MKVICVLQKYNIMIFAQSQSLNVPSNFFKQFVAMSWVWGQTWRTVNKSSLSMKSFHRRRWDALQWAAFILVIWTVFISSYRHSDERNRNSIINRSIHEMKWDSYVLLQSFKVNLFALLCFDVFFIHCKTLYANNTFYKIRLKMPSFNDLLVISQESFSFPCMHRDHLHQVLGHSQIVCSHRTVLKKEKKKQIAFISAKNLILWTNLN